MYLDKKSETLKVIQHMRDEAHRFGITHHRNRRSKNFAVSSLTEIQGIGDKTTETLLKEFKSVKKIASASLEELSSKIGQKAAASVYKHFHPEANE